MWPIRGREGQNSLPLCYHGHWCLILLYRTLGAWHKMAACSLPVGAAVETVAFVVMTGDVSSPFLFFEGVPPVTAFAVGVCAVVCPPVWPAPWPPCCVLPVVSLVVLLVLPLLVLLLLLVVVLLLLVVVFAAAVFALSVLRNLALRFWNQTCQSK